jgi:hypothetical protein
MLSKFKIAKALLCLILLWGNFSFAQVPTDILLSNHNFPENEDLYTFIGSLSAIDANQSAGHEFHLIKEEDDNSFFRVRGDSLFSFFSFNFENKDSYTILIKTKDADNNILIKSLGIYIMDVTGKYDQNGIADADLANKYPQVNVGDYIYFNGVGNNQAIYAQNNGFPSISFPNKVLIRGDHYQAISINCVQLNGNNINQRIPIGNFLGQVYVSGYISFSGGSFWRLTGAHEPSLGLGSTYYKGCHQNNSTVDFGFSNGNYGIWVSREWIDEGTNLLKVSGTATGFEIDHTEISDGGFAGLMLKYDDMNIHSMDDVEVHHLYIHDIGSEGMYIGSTQIDPQHVFNNLHIHHCAVLRTGGEAIQIEQQSGGCLVEHNVIWGAFDWLSPFNRWQDNVFQLGAINGDITIRNNILMGAAGNAFNAFNRPKTGITPNGLPITFENNLIWCSRSNVGIYQGGASDGVTPWVWKDNYAGKFFFDWDRVYTTAVNRPHILFIGIHNSNITASVTGNRFDSTRSGFHTLWGNGSVQVTASNNNQIALDNPQFRYFLEEDDAFNYLKWTRWTANIGEEPNFPATNTNKGQAVIYALGEVVQYHANGRTRFYKCLQTHSRQEPVADGNAYWELITWNNQGNISYSPPDDVRLDLGSFYYTENIGLESASNTFVVDAGADQSKFTPASTIIFEGNAYGPNSSISSFQWTKIAGNNLALSGQNTQYLSCNNPLPGTYTFLLTATTVRGLVGTDTVLLHVLEEPQAPIANAGNDIGLSAGLTSTSLDGSASSTPTGQIASYQWNLISADQHPFTKTFINFTNSTHQASSPWNNSIGTTTSGTIINNLTDSLGNNTSIGIELLDSWDGINAGGMVTGDNSGVFSDPVIKVSYWFQTGTRQLRVFGLNPNELYNFEFFGSKYGGGNRTTIYSIGEKNTSLNAAYNSTTTANLDWIEADDNGEVLIQVSKGNGAIQGYLNALVIKKTNLMLSPSNTVMPTITGLTNGTYLVELKVINDECLSDLDTVSIVVGLTNQSSIHSNKIENSILIHPNPSANWVTLSIDDYNNPLQCKVHTLEGKLIHTQAVQNAQTSLNIQRFPAGIYLIDLRNELGHVIWRSKLIKQ